MCTWAWELLTERLKLEPDRLYVSYFGGSAAAGLEPDNETRDIWISLGSATLPEDLLYTSVTKSLLEKHNLNNI